MHPKMEVARLLGLDPRVLTKCMHYASISPVSDPHDARKQLLSDEMVDAIRAAHVALYGHAPYGDLVAEVEQLKRRVARLEAHPAPVLPAALLDPLPPLPVPLPRPRRVTRHLRELSERPALPDGWVTLEAWAKRHTLSPAAAKKAATVGHILVTHDPDGYSQGWGMGFADWVLTPEQQQEAHHNANWRARFGDPCQWCGYGSGTGEGRASVTERADEHSRP